MAKEKKIFFCKECGYESGRWLGQCPGCKEWNTFVEQEVKPVRGSKTVSVMERPKPSSIKEISSAEETRIMTGIGELDRVLGGGIVKGSLVLVGGAPGIGKSTLLLEMCRNLVEKNAGVLYVSGEESLSQIKMRGVRLGAYDDRLLIMSDNDIDNIEAAIEECKSDVVIIDSIQTMEAPGVDSAPGTITQVREVTSRMLQLSKRLGVAVFIVGHVTKEGTVAGPRTLEHMVDCVLYFEGDDSAGFRLLRAEKNRFGSTNEVGVFNMTDKGLEGVSNPSQMFLNGRPAGASGSVVVSTIEGTRAILVELQALCADSSFNMPRRTAVGVDYNRVNLLIAVLEKRGGISLSGCDCYVNIAGGMKVAEPSTDLGIICAITSSFRDRAVGDDLVIIGEVGLAGEIRGVRSCGQRVREAAKMGYKRAMIPKSNMNSELESISDIEIIPVSTIREAMDII
ncbi:MAG: DNA repair protein RadA [Eubacterium sp.]|nr:DNA repair protein RadA [Eubacterium sp.]